MVTNILAEKSETIFLYDLSQPLFEPRTVDKLVKRRDENSSVDQDKSIY